MVDTVKDFELDLVKFVAKINVSAELAIAKIALDLYSAIIMKTPVDTGRAMASWNLSVGSIDSSVPPEMSGKGKPASSVIAAGAAGFDPNIISTVYITSNLPYIEALEQGSSDQAPNGMVQLSLAELRTFILGAL